MNPDPEEAKKHMDPPDPYPQHCYWERCICAGGRACARNGWASCRGSAGKCRCAFVRKTTTLVRVRWRRRQLAPLAVVGKINRFIFKASIFWEKVKVSLAFENYWPRGTKYLRNECSVEIKGSNYNEIFICFYQRSKVKRCIHRSCPPLTSRHQYPPIHVL